MDGPNIDHSDSDSGESWTLLDHSPVHVECAPESVEVPRNVNGATDEDTDGISIISDSDHESISQCEPTALAQHTSVPEDHPQELHTHQYFLDTPLAVDQPTDNHECLKEDDFLADSSGKHRTYVHKRNKRLSTVLNIIVLGSIITATGVAIGHMWGVRDDCMIQTTPSVNKILSNLYKLQEENAYLRSKVKELTLANNLLNHRPVNNDKWPKHRCRKVFEEPLNKKNIDKLTKCVDFDFNNVNERNADIYTLEPEIEKEFLSDIDKLRNVYKQNKSWLDEEIARRQKLEQASINIIKSQYQPVTKEVNKGSDVKKEDHTKTDVLSDKSANKGVETKKVSYADSLKSVKKVYKRELSDVHDDQHKENNKKKKIKKQLESDDDDTFTDEENIKDSRYSGQKHKEKKNHDRSKDYRKHKRNNKYEQWEMKGGYMKDYDDISIASILENNKLKDQEQLPKDSIVQLNEKFVTDKEFLDKNGSQMNINKPTNKKDKSRKNKEKNVNWYENRVAQRTEARKKIEQELFGEHPNAGWYFRRMQRREQCRYRGDNDTQRKQSKRRMNYKTKH